MTKAGQLEQPQRLVIGALRIYVSNNTILTDVQNFLLNVSSQFIIGKKPFWEGPCLLLQAGCGVIQYSAAQLGTAPAGTATVVGTSNGVADPRSVFTLNMPITIEGGEGFSWILNPETGFSFAANTTNPPGTGATIYVVLDGVLYRGVQ